MKNCLSVILEMKYGCAETRKLEDPVIRETAVMTYIIYRDACESNPVAT